MKHNDHQYNPTFKPLGRYLKTMRQRLQESLGETSGAVEINVEQLDRFERGAELPSEDILMLLISHFGLQDDEAVKIWELAGYEQPSRQSPSDGRGEDIIVDDGQLRQTMHVMLLALDNRILYTNGVEIMTDNAGIVLNFTQGSSEGSKAGSVTQQKRQTASSNGTAQPVVPVSRVGMSYDQAEQLLQTLQRALLHKQYLSGPKQLPPPGQ